MLKKMELVQIPEKSHGHFYDGDCYVLLSVSCWLTSDLFILTLVHTQTFPSTVPSPDPEGEQFIVLRHPLLDRLWVLARRTGCSSCLHHPAWRVPGLRSCATPWGSEPWVWCFQRILQTGSNVRESVDQEGFLIKQSSKINVKNE